MALRLVCCGRRAVMETYRIVDRPICRTDLSDALGILPAGSLLMTANALRIADRQAVQAAYPAR